MSVSSSYGPPAGEGGTIRFRYVDSPRRAREVGFNVGPDGRLPERAHQTDAGLDLFASTSGVLPPPGTYAGRNIGVVGTDVRVELPDDCCALVVPRSGLAAKFGVTVLNAPGLIDAGYRGEIKVVLINHGPVPFIVEPGMKVAQLLIVRWENVLPVSVPALSASARGEGGFGSTGR